MAVDDGTEPKAISKRRVLKHVRMDTDDVRADPAVAGPVALPVGAPKI